MKTHFSNLVIIIFIVSTFNCKGQMSSDNLKKEDFKSNKIEIESPKTKELLELELSKGVATSNSQGESPNLEIDEVYFKSTIPILKQMLNKNNFNFNELNFKKKSIEIFRILKPFNEIEHISFYDKCKIDDYPYATWEGGKMYNYHLLGKEFFLTQTYHLPELIDYKSLYALSEIEDTIRIRYPDNYDKNEEIIVTRWKDIPDLDEQREFNIQLLVNRNLYLFNDDKSRLPWLLKNDKYFMRSLVLNFGWTEDEKLLSWVIENTLYDRNHPEEFAKLFYTKDCDGTLRLQSNTFKYLQKTIKATDNKVLREMNSLITDWPSKPENLTDQEWLEVLANIAYFGEQYKYNEKTKDYGKFMGRMRFHVIEDEVKEKNYFNLPKFKEWWDSADYDEYFVKECEYLGSCGRDYYPPTEVEWRKMKK